jgi:hypothetical protein
MGFAGEVDRRPRFDGSGTRMDRRGNIAKHTARAPGNGRVVGCTVARRDRALSISFSV